MTTLTEGNGVLTFLSLAVITFAVFLLGTLAGWAWHRHKGDHSRDLARRINLGLSSFFVLVAVLVSTDLILLQVRFTNYVQETLPRDRSQERCNSDTLTVLKNWVDARQRRDHSIDTRDDALIVVLNRVIAGQKATPEEIMAWRDAVIGDRRIRAEAAQELAPLPEC